MSPTEFRGYEPAGRDFSVVSIRRARAASQFLRLPSVQGDTARPSYEQTFSKRITVL